MAVNSRYTLALLLTLSFGLGIFHIVSFDVWWHIKTGEWMVKNAAFPLSDPFSYTTLGREWIYHNWLFDLPLYLVNAGFGVTGLIVMRGLLVGFFGFSVYRLLRNHTSVNLAAVLSILVLAAIRIRFFLRPSLATFICFTLLFIVLTYLYEREKVTPRDFWPVPLIMAIWANLHAGVVFGVILMGSFWLSRITERKESKSFFLILVAGSVAGLLNPNFYSIYLYSFKYLAFKSAMTVTNIEHMPPAGITEGAHVFFFWLLVYGGAILFLLRIRRARPYFWILLAGFGYLGLTSLRGVPFFSVAMAVAIASTWGKSDLKISTATAALLMSVITVAAIFTQPHAVKFEVSPASVPVSAVDFVEKAGLKGEMFNSHPYGGYLIYRLYPGRKVFIDGRDLLHEKTMKMVKDVGYMRTLNAFKVEWILAGYPDGILQEIPKNLWTVVFFDDLAVILAKNGGKNKEIIEKYGYRHITPFDNIEEKIMEADEETKKEINKELKRAIDGSNQAGSFRRFLEMR